MKTSLMGFALCAVMRAQGPAPDPAAAPAKVGPASTPTRAPAPAKLAVVLPYKLLTYPAMHSVQPARIETFELPNGMKLYLSENHELPIIEGTAVVRTGSVFDPPGKAGLAHLAGIVMRSGGTVLKTGAQLEEALDNVGARIDVKIGQTYGSVRFACLKEDPEEAIGMFKDVLTAPAFRQDKVEAGKAQLRWAIGQRNDDPRQILDREFRSLILGKETPYAVQEEYATVGSIQRTDLAAFHRRYFFPANTMLEVHGDFDAARMKALLEKVFADWTAQQAAVPELPKMGSGPGGTYLAVKKNHTRAVFAIGSNSTGIKGKDEAVLEVILDLLAGNSASRLAHSKTPAAGVMELSAMRNPFEPGVFGLAGAAPNEVAVDLIKGIREEVQNLRTTEVTDVELSAAREIAVGRLALEVDTATKMVIRMVTGEYYGYPRDFPAQHQKDLAAVTRGDVLRVAKEYLDPSRFTQLLVGDPQDFVKLDTLGGAPVTVDLTIPAAPAEKMVTDASTLEKGKALLRKAREATGGEQKWADVKDMIEVMTYAFASSAGGGSSTRMDRWIAPHALRQDTATATGRMYVYTNKPYGWMSNGRNAAALSGDQLQHVSRDLFRLYPRLLESDRIEGRVVSGLDDETVEIAEGDLLARLVLDPATGRPAKILYEATTANGSVVAVEEELQDFREVGGIQAPHKILILQNGMKLADVTVTELKWNSGLKVEDLQKRP